jgi:hypothetical protein
VNISPPPEVRFWNRVNTEQECWSWGGAHDRYGYSVFSINNKSVKVHRYAYELLVGPIPDGLTIDHLCSNAGCVNPEHMEPVSASENTRRAALRRPKKEPAPKKPDGRKTRVWPVLTHCPHGHEFTQANTKLQEGTKVCRKCCALRQRAYTARKRASMGGQS